MGERLLVFCSWTYSFDEIRRSNAALGWLVVFVFFFKALAK